MAKNAPAQYVIYSRKSRFTGKGESIENQIEMCRQHIALHCGEEAAKKSLVYEDEGFSGGNLERPQFKKMMQDARQKNFTAIVVYRLDRISRNIGDFAKLIEELNGMGIEFVSIREQFDTRSPMGRAMMYISSVFSQLERETIAERIRDNMHELAKSGRWLGGNTPTGYTSESVSRITLDGKKRQVCRLKIIPEEMQLVRVIYEKYLELHSLTKVDAYLLEHRYETKKGNRFTRAGIKSILSNPVYMIADQEAFQYWKDCHVELFSAERDFDGIHGMMAYNRTIQQAGKANRMRPMEAWIVAVGAHEGIISGADWVKVQRMLSHSRDKRYGKPRGNVALLSGLLCCGSCGDHMRPKLTARRQEDGNLTYSYICTTKERSRGSRCKMKNINGNSLDKMVLEELKRLPFDSGEFLRRLNYVRRSLSAGQGTAEEKTAAIREKIKGNERAIKKRVDTLMNLSDTAAEQYVLKQIEELHERGEELRRRLREQEEFRQKEHRMGEFDRLAAILSSFPETIDGMSVEQKRLAIRAVMEKIVWDGERVHLYLLGGEGLDGTEKKTAQNQTEYPAGPERWPLCMDSK